MPTSRAERHKKALIRKPARHLHKPFNALPKSFVALPKCFVALQKSFAALPKSFASQHEVYVWWVLYLIPLLPCNTLSVQSGLITKHIEKHIFLPQIHRLPQKEHWLSAKNLWKSVHLRLFRVNYLRPDCPDYAILISHVFAKKSCWRVGMSVLN